MPSYRIVPIPSDGVKGAEKARAAVEKLSIKDDVSDFRRGTIPESFASLGDYTYWFKYGVEDEMDVPTVDDEKSVQYCKKKVVGVLDSKFLIIEKCNKGLWQDIVSILKHQFVTSNVMLSRIQFSQDDLRFVLNEGSNLLKANITPNERTDPEAIAVYDREVRDTSTWKENSDEPLKKVKMEVLANESENKVGFSEDGKIILHEWSLEEDQQFRVLLGLDEILDEIAIPDRFQYTYDDWTGDSDESESASDD